MAINEETIKMKITQEQLEKDIELCSKARTDLKEKRPHPIGWREDVNSLWVEIQLLRHQLESLQKGEKRE